MPILPFKATQVQLEQIKNNGITQVDRDNITIAGDESIIIYNLDSSSWEYWDQLESIWKILGAGNEEVLHPPIDGGGNFMKPEPVGGIENTVEESTILDGMTAVEVLTRMLYPVKYPVITQPSATLDLDPPGAGMGAGDAEYGSIINPAMLINFDQGSVEINYDMYDPLGNLIDPSTYSGMANVYEFFIDNMSAYLPDVLVADNSFIYQNPGDARNILYDTKYSVTINYDAGIQLYDSIGNPWGTPIPAGSVTLENWFYYTYPIFHNGDTLSNDPISGTKIITRRPELLDNHRSLNTIVYTWQEDLLNRHSFAIADDFGALSKVEFYSEISETWQTVSYLTLYDVSPGTYTVENGNILNCTVYTRNGPLEGPITIRITVV